MCRNARFHQRGSYFPEEISWPKRICWIGIEDTSWRRSRFADYEEESTMRECRPLLRKDIKEIAESVRGVTLCVLSCFIKISILDRYLSIRVRERPSSSGRRIGNRVLAFSPITSAPLTSKACHRSWSTSGWVTVETDRIANMLLPGASTWRALPLAPIGIRKTFVNQVGEVVLSDLPWHATAGLDPLAQKYIRSRKQITDKHRAGKLCDSGRSRRRT